MVLASIRENYEDKKHQYFVQFTYGSDRITRNSAELSNQIPSSEVTYQYDTDDQAKEKHYRPDILTYDNECRQTRSNRGYHGKTVGSEMTDKCLSHAVVSAVVRTKHHECLRPACEGRRRQQSRYLIAIV